MLVLLSACTLFLGHPHPRDTHADARTCDDVLDDMAAELVDIQACTDDDQCGQVLHGTSCGCTRNLVARVDADLTEFERLQDEILHEQCDWGTSTCDCPEAYGFACVQGTCAWAYTGSYAWLPTCDAEHGDAYDTYGASVSGDTLLLSVGYGGGCATHTFTLCWPDGTFMESWPVQVSLDVVHDAADDPCDAYLTEDVALDLSPVRQAYVAAYGESSATVVVHVAGYEVAYTF